MKRARARSGDSDSLLECGARPAKPMMAKSVCPPQEHTNRAPEAEERERTNGIAAAGKPRLQVAGQQPNPKPQRAHTHTRGL